MHTWKLTAVTCERELGETRIEMQVKTTSGDVRQAMRELEQFRGLHARRTQDGWQLLYDWEPVETLPERSLLTGEPLHYAQPAGAEHATGPFELRLEPAGRHALA